MSRTYRKRGFQIVSNQEDFNYWLDNGYTEQSMIRMIATFYGDNHDSAYTVPKHFRKTVEQWRRARNKQQIHKLIKDNEYPANMQPCNGKDNRVWDFY